MPHTALELRSASVVDPVERTVRPRTTVYMTGERIAGVGEPPPGWPGEANVEVVDCAGRYLLPGLIDAHVHLRASPHQGPSSDRPVPPLAEVPPATGNGLNAHVGRLHTFLYCGVTAVYDAGNDPDIVYGLRELERSGTTPAPRVHCTGRLITSPGGHGAQAGMEVGGPEDVDRVVAEHLAAEPDLVKITYDEHNWGVRPLISILEPAVLRRIIDAVHAAGQRVAVHVSNELRAREAVDCGADVLAHPVIQSPVTEEFVDLLADRQLPVVSTLAIGERYFRLADDAGFVDTGFYANCDDDTERTRLKTEENAAQRANRWADWMRVMTPVAQENLRMLAAAGGVVAAGTDLSFGPDFHRELELLQQAGIPPMEIIRAATHHGARVLGREDELGTVAVGALADLLVVDADPTSDVRNLSTISTVLKGGRVVDRSSLDLPVNGGGTHA